MSDLFDTECPICHEEIEVEVSRWTTYFKCPKCNGALKDDYDLIYIEETYEEWDIHNVIPDI